MQTSPLRNYLKANKRNCEFSIREPIITGWKKPVTGQRKSMRPEAAILLHFLIKKLKKPVQCLHLIHVRFCSHDTRTSFILEWVLFQNEVRTAFTWQNRHPHPSWKWQFCPPSWKWYACATCRRLRGLRFPLGTEFVFSSHDTRMKCHTRTRISFALKTGMNSFQNDLCRNEISSRYRK